MGSRWENYYLCYKKLTGKEYAVSTNSDIFQYSIEGKSTRNLTSENMGYDTRPVLSPDGKWIAYLSMKTAGNEADKNRMMILNTSTYEITNISEMLDESVDALYWSPDSKQIFMQQPNKGTISLFAFDWDGFNKGLKKYPIEPVINGYSDVTGVVGFTDTEIIFTRTDMNHAAEIFGFNKSKNEVRQISKVNDAVYNSIALSKVESHWIKTTDNKEMLVYVILPPNFDPNKNTLQFYIARAALKVR